MQIKLIKNKQLMREKEKRIEILEKSTSEKEFKINKLNNLMFK